MHYSKYKEMEKAELLDEKSDTKRERKLKCDDCCNFDFYFPRRYIVTIMLFIGMVITNAMRVNIGVTVVGLNPKMSHFTPHNEDGLMQIAQLPWTNTMLGWLHAIFYIGLLISQVPCGYIVTKFPSYRLYGLCILLTCGFNLLLPVSISYVGYVFTCIIRFIQGFIEGMLYPSCYDVLRIWSLPEEKSRMGAAVLTGSYIGPVFGMVLSGVLLHFWGWVYVFYIHGLVGLLWYGFWFVLIFQNADLHPSISSDERKLIEVKQGEAAIIYEDAKVPWGSIFTSLPVYSLIICNFARSFVFYMLLTNQPTYLNTFGFSYLENGLYSSLPHALMSLFCVISGALADWLLSTSWLSSTLVRKIFTSIGFGIEALCFFALALIDDGILAVIFLTIGVGISGIAISGWQINHLDLAPRFAGVLVAITMTFGTLAGVTNPLIVAALTYDKTIESWHNVFWMTGAILIAAAIFYIAFGSGDRQPWAMPRPPAMRIISNGDTLNSKPYGTFRTQMPSTSQEPDLNSDLAEINREDCELPHESNLKQRSSSLGHNQLQP